MLAVPLGDMDVERSQQAARPQAGRHHNRVGVDRSLRGLHPGDAPIPHSNGGDGAAFENVRPVTARRLGVGGSQVGGIDPPGQRVQPCCGHGAGVDQRVQPRGLGARDHARADPAPLRLRLISL